jgi:hypothetical protein
VIRLATTAEYDKARAAVLGGTATARQVSLVEAEASQAGQRGSDALQALKKAGRR